MVRQLLLEDAGYRVLPATSGTEALRIFTSNPIDLVLSDHYLRGELGTAVAAQMKALKPEVPIVILSGSTQQPEGMEHADGFISKSSDAADLLAAITRYLNA
jgi:CheY-like chemotaxis protein